MLLICKDRLCGECAAWIFVMHFFSGRNVRLDEFANDGFSVVCLCMTGFDNTYT